MARLVPAIYPDTRPFLPNIVTLGSPNANPVFGRRANGERPGNTQRRLATKSMLVLRVNAQDSSPTHTAAQLSDKVFGTDGDLVNLKSQYWACSDGQLDFQPATGAGITNGVYDVSLGQNVLGVRDYSVRPSSSS